MGQLTDHLVQGEPRYLAFSVADPPVLNEELYFLGRFLTPPCARFGLRGLSCGAGFPACRLRCWALADNVHPGSAGITPSSRSIPCGVIFTIQRSTPDNGSAPNSAVQIVLRTRYFEILLQRIHRGEHPRPLKNIIQVADGDAVRDISPDQPQYFAPRP